MKKHLEKTQLSESFVTCCWSLLYRYLFYSTDFNWYIDVLKKFKKNHTWGFEHNCSVLPFSLCHACLLASRVFVAGICREIGSH